MYQAARKQDNFNNNNSDQQGASPKPHLRVLKPTGKTDPGEIDLDLEKRVENACAKLSHLLGRVAGRFARRLPSHVELDDLVGAGGVGLVTAVRQHIEKPAPDLKRLVEQRIRGAILDYLRSVDHLTRRQRAAVSAVNRAKLRLAHEGSEQDVGRVAEQLGITLERAEQIQNHLAVVQVTSIEDSEQLRNQGPNPAQEAMHQELKSRLVHSLTRLPKRLQTLLSLYYCESLTYKEIGDLLGISRSRICQLHTQAIAELRNHMACVLS